MPVAGGGHAARPTSVAREERLVRRDVEVHRPVLARDLVARPPAAVERHARQPELLSLRRLQVVPDGPAVWGPELVAGDLHVHLARVHQAPAAAVGADGPDPVHLVPGSLVAVHQQAGVGRGELDVVEPVGRAVDRLDLAGGDRDREERHGKTSGPARLQARFLRRGRGLRVLRGRG